MNRKVCNRDIKVPFLAWRRAVGLPFCTDVWRKWTSRPRRTPIGVVLWCSVEFAVVLCSLAECVVTSILCQPPGVFVSYFCYVEHSTVVYIECVRISSVICKSVMKWWSFFLWMSLICSSINLFTQFLNYRCVYRFCFGITLNVNGGSWWKFMGGLHKARGQGGRVDVG